MLDDKIVPLISEECLSIDLLYFCFVNYEPIQKKKSQFLLKISSLLSKGRQILMKDNLIDEERAKQEEAAQESLEQKLERLGKKNVTP